MTETTQDIQAQIDRLDLDWLKDLEGYRYQYGFSKQLPVKGDVFKRKALLAVSGIIALAVGTGGFSQILGLLTSLISWKGLAVLGGVILFLSFILRELSKQEAASVRYQQALAEYESKRAELQAKLDALN